MRGFASIRKMWATLFAFGLAFSTAAQNQPEVPPEIKSPAGEEVILRAHAKGVQIYSCQAGSDEKYAWALKAPKADLFDDQGKLIGTHFAGPTWKLNDGSRRASHSGYSCDGASQISDFRLHSGNFGLIRRQFLNRRDADGGDERREALQVGEAFANRGTGPLSGHPAAAEPQHVGPGGQHVQEARDRVSGRDGGRRLGSDQEICGARARNLIDHQHRDYGPGTFASHTCRRVFSKAHLWGGAQKGQDLNSSGQALRQSSPQHCRT